MTLSTLTRRAPMAKLTTAVNPPTLPKPLGYSHGWETQGGKTLYMAGQVAFDKNGALVGKGDLVAQFRQVCENLKTLVTAADGQLADVVKLTMYVLDTAEFKRLGQPIGVIYREYFGKHFPAMTLVGVRDLYDASEGCLIEIEGFACLAE
jgi:enamine deaminase RidA (YjgF/YER057c/UK114 family)